MSERRAFPESERKRERESDLYDSELHSRARNKIFFSERSLEKDEARRWRIAISIFAHEFAVVENKVVHPGYECRWIDIICARK